MKPEEIKARKEWLKSMHLRPVYYLVEEGVAVPTEELSVYIAIARVFYLRLGGGW